METNFYRQSAINQNLTFDKTYSSRLEMEIAQNKINGRVVDDGIFPKRLIIINYALKPSNWDDEKMPSWGYPNNEKGYFKYNANRDNSYYQNNYDSTVWQKVRGTLKSFSWSDETWSSTNEEGWIYQQIAELDSITIEVNTLDLNENQASILVGANEEGVGVPVYAGSFLNVEAGSDDNGVFYTLTHESDFTSHDIPTSTANKLNFRDFSIEKAHVINSKSLSLQAEDDIVLNSTNTNDYTISHKNSTINSAHTVDNLFDVTNKKIFIDEPGFDIHGHLESKGSKSFSFSIVGDEDIISSDYAADNNVITLKHKDDYNIHSFTNNKSTVISDGEDEPEDVLTFSIPRFEINKFGHVEKVSGSSVWENDPYIYSDGVIYFDIHPIAEEGRICHRDRLILPKKDNQLIENTDYELYNPIEKVDTAFGDRARFYFRIPIFDNKGHIIKNQGNLASHCIYCDFMGDENITVSSAQSNSTDGAKIQSAIFTHKEYNHTELEDLYNIKTVSPAYSETMENIQSYEQYYDYSLSSDKVYKFKFYKKVVWNISMLPGSSYYYKIYYLNDASKTDLSGAAIIESETTGTPGLQTQRITGTFEEKLYPEQELVLEIGPQVDVFFYPTTAVQGYTNNNFTQLSISNFLFNNAGHYRDKNYYEDIDLTEEIKLEYETEVQEIIDTAEKFTAQIYLDILAKVKYPLFYVNEETGSHTSVAQDTTLSNLPNMLKTSKGQLKINWLKGQYKIRKSNENTTLILNPNNFQINQEKDSNHIAIDLSNSLLNRINQLEARIAELENK